MRSRGSRQASGDLDLAGRSGRRPDRRDPDDQRGLQPRRRRGGGRRCRQRHLPSRDRGDGGAAAGGAPDPAPLHGAVRRGHVGNDGGHPTDEGLRGLCGGSAGPARDGDRDQRAALLAAAPRRSERATMSKAARRATGLSGRSRPTRCSAGPATTSSRAGRRRQPRWRCGARPARGRRRQRQA